MEIVGPHHSSRTGIHSETSHLSYTFLSFFSAAAAAIVKAAVQTSCGSPTTVLNNHRSIILGRWHSPVDDKSLGAD